MYLFPQKTKQEERQQKKKKKNHKLKQQQQKRKIVNVERCAKTTQTQKVKMKIKYIKLLSLNQ